MSWDWNFSVTYFKSAVNFGNWCNIKIFSTMWPSLSKSYWCYKFWEEYKLGQTFISPKYHVLQRGLLLHNDRIKSRQIKLSFETMEMTIGFCICFYYHYLSLFSQTWPENKQKRHLVRIKLSWTLERVFRNKLCTPVYFIIIII